MSDQCASVEDDPYLSGIVERLVAEFQPEAVYLYGSRARGDHRADSDYDLFLVMPDGTASERMSLVTMFEATGGFPVAVEAVACRRSVFESKKLVPGTLSWAVRTEGVLIHGRLRPALRPPAGPGK